MVELVAFALFGCSLVASAYVVRLTNMRRLNDSRVTHSLRFPRGLDVEAVTAFCRSVNGLTGPWWRRPFGSPCLVFETVATSRGVAFRISTPHSASDYVLGQLRSLVPGIRFDAVAKNEGAKFTSASELNLTNTRSELRIEHPEYISKALLGALHPLTDNEAIVLQLVVSPGAPVQSQARSNSAEIITSVAKLVAGRKINIGDRRPQPKRSLEPYVWATLRVGARAVRPERARQLQARVGASFHAIHGPGVHLRRRLLPSSLVAKRVAKRTVPILVASMPLSCSTFAVLLGWPLGSPQVPGLALGASRQLAPTPDIPTRGLVLARSNFPGLERDLALTVEAAMSGIALIGPTGVGKSSTILSLIQQIIALGHGLLVVDPTGELAHHVLAALDLRRERDLILLDPTSDYLVGFNVLDGFKHAPHLIADLVVRTLRHRWSSSSWGPRLEETLYATAYALAAAGMTVVEIVRLLSDESYLRQTLQSVDDPVSVEAIFAWYLSLSPQERAQVAAPVLNKARGFSRPAVRGIVGQQHSTFRPEEALAKGQIVIASLPTGLLGDASGDLAGLILTRMWAAITARAEVPAAARKPFFIVVDEVAEMLNLPVSVGTALAQSRKWNVSWCVAFQSVSQLPSRGGLRSEILANARTKLVWQTSAADAATLAREFAPHLTAEDLMGLPRYEVAALINIGGAVATPVTGTALPPPSPSVDDVDGLRARVLARYGRRRDEVEDEIRARQASAVPKRSVGRRRTP